MALFINGERVDDTVLEAEFSGIKAYHERLGNVSCCERNDEFRGYARQNIIARVLLTQHALASIPAPTEDEVEAAYQKLIAEHGGETRFLHTIGASEEHIDSIKHDLSTNLRVERLIDRQMAAEPAPTDDELLSYYNENLSRFMTPEELRASHISKSPPRGEDRAAAYEEYRHVRKQLLAGADFDELARKHSERGHEQIDLGYFRRGELPEEFDLVAFSMNVGEISPVFGSSVGYHIIKLTDRREPVAKPFDSVRDEVLRQVLESRRHDKIRQVVATLEKSATIEDVTEDISDEVESTT